MYKYSSQFAEIVLRILPARLPISERQSTGEEETAESGKRLYEVLVYSDLDLPNIQQTQDTEERPHVAGLPFVGKEQITFHWDKYQDYHANFVEAEKAFSMMGGKLRSALSPGLRKLFSEPPDSQKPLRLWLNGETPELDDLPWELISGPGGDPNVRFFLARGLPPETPTPIIPIGEKLKIALIHQNMYIPRAFEEAMRELPDTLEIRHINLSPLKAIEQAVSEGCEIIHIISDGIISLAYEGILYFHRESFQGENEQAEKGENYPMISPNELCVVLRNSRVGLLCLTEQDYSNPDSMPIAGREVPSVYRAFTYLGGSRLALPSVIAPLGPLDFSQMKDFWKDFYTNLAETLNPQRAISQARNRNAPPLPVAFFLRHSQDVLFRHELHQPEVDPVHIDAALRLSRDLVSQLKVHEEIYGDLPPSMNEFVSSEEQKQETLSAELEHWLTPEEEAS